MEVTQWRHRVAHTSCTPSAAARRRLRRSGWWEGAVVSTFVSTLSAIEAKLGDTKRHEVAKAGAERRGLTSPNAHRPARSVRPNLGVQVPPPTLNHRWSATAGYPVRGLCGHRMVTRVRGQVARSIFDQGAGRTAGERSRPRRPLVNALSARPKRLGCGEQFGTARDRPTVRLGCFGIRRCAGEPQPCRRTVRIGSQVADA